MGGMDGVKKIEQLSISVDWCKAVGSIFENQTRHPPTVIVCGAKGVGKSTLCRLVPLHMYYIYAIQFFFIYKEYDSCLNLRVRL